MLYVTTVTSQKELEQIQKLSLQNLKQSLSDVEMEEQGFVSWFYSLELLKKMHQLAPSVIVKEKDRDEVIGYALVTLKEAGSFHEDLQAMITNLRNICFLNKPLLEHEFYIMGQVCIHKDYRGKGVFNLLYNHHKKSYSKDYNLLVTEISTSNKRSIKAHKNLGFKNIHTYRDSMDEWNVVVWDWCK